MKSKLLIITLSLTLSAFVSACPEQSYEQSKESCDRGQRQGGHRTMMIEKLNLSEDQRTKFDEIMQGRKQNMQENMKQGHEQTKLLLAEVLTEEQMQIMEDNRPEHPRKQNKKRRHHDDRK